MNEAKNKRDWGLFALGILLALCGVFIFAAPGMTLALIAIIAGSGFLVTGIFDIINYFRFKKVANMSGWSLAYAILDILVGLMFLVHPLVFASVIPWLIGLFFILFGVFEVVGSFKLKNMGMKTWGWMLFSGVIGALCGVMFFVYPLSAAIYLAIFVIMRGISLAIYGVTANKEA